MVSGCSSQALLTELASPLPLSHPSALCPYSLGPLRPHPPAIRGAHTRHKPSAWRRCRRVDAAEWAEASRAAGPGGTGNPHFLFSHKGPLCPGQGCAFSVNTLILSPLHQPAPAPSSSAPARCPELLLGPQCSRRGTPVSQGLEQNWGPVGLAPVTSWDGVSTRNRSWGGQGSRLCPQAPLGLRPAQRRGEPRPRDQAVLGHPGSCRGMGWHPADGQRGAVLRWGSPGVTHPSPYRRLCWGEVGRAPPPGV